MKSKLFLFSAVLFASQNVFGSDIVGKWTEPAPKSYQSTQLELGGEDFEPIKLEPVIVEAKSKRVIEFKKDGTGTFKDSIQFPEQKEFKFTWILTGEADSAVRNVFIAFDQPFEKQKRPLLIFAVKQSSQDQVVLSAIKKNSSLGDWIKGIKFERLEEVAPK